MTAEIISVLAGLAALAVAYLAGQLRSKQKQAEKRADALKGVVDADSKIAEMDDDAVRDRLSDWVRDD